MEKLTKAQVKENIEIKLSRYFGCTPDEASKDQMYKAVSMTIRDMLSSKRNDFKHAVNDAGAKRVYYMCMEFLMGRSLKTNLCNLGLDKEYYSVAIPLGATINMDGAAITITVMSQRAMFTGMFAAELRVKNAVMPDSRRQRKVKG